MIEKLRLLNNKLIELCSNDTDLRKQELIKKILSDDRCFFEMGIEEAYAILRDLGFQENDLKDVYMELIDIKNF